MRKGIRVVAPAGRPTCCICGGRTSFSVGRLCCLLRRRHSARLRLHRISACKERCSSSTCRQLVRSMTPTALSNTSMVALCGVVICTVSFADRVDSHRSRHPTSYGTWTEDSSRVSRGAMGRWRFLCKQRLTTSRSTTSGGVSVHAIDFLATRPYELAYIGRHYEGNRDNSTAEQKMTE